MIKAWIFLAYATFLIKTCNMEKLQVILQKRKAQCKEEIRVQEAEIIFHNITETERFFFTRIACLEKSLAVFLLATSQGKSIDMVIGVKLAPFASHAWVEVEGVPVHEEEEIGTYRRMLMI
jgi:ATP-binding cassette subfamily B protein